MSAGSTPKILKVIGPIDPKMPENMEFKRMANPVTNPKDTEEDQRDETINKIIPNRH